MDNCPTCGRPMDDFRFHLVASPNADALKGEHRGMPRYTLHREHLLQEPTWRWEYLCVECFYALPCAPDLTAQSESQREVNFR